MLNSKRSGSEQNSSRIMKGCGLVFRLYLKLTLPRLSKESPCITRYVLFVTKNIIIMYLCLRNGKGRGVGKEGGYLPTQFFEKNDHGD